MKIAEQLYIYLWTDQRENNCNTIFIDGKVPCLIDPGLARRVPSLFERMRADGLDPRQIKVVISTHGHPDHFEGTHAFMTNSVKLGMSRQEEKFIEEVGRPMFLQHGIRMPEYRVDFFLGDGNLSLGRHDFLTLVTPGHSPGSLCIYWPRYKALFPGDVIFANGVGRTDLPGGDIQALRGSLDRLSRLDIDLLVPGHGPAIQGAQKVRKNFEFVKRSFLGTR